MGHDGCWHTTTEGNEFSVAFQPEDDELSFTPDDYPVERVNAVLTITLAVLVGFILGRAAR